MSEDNVTYYRRRAEVELERAQVAVSAAVLHPHLEMANAYLARVAEAELAIQTNDVR